MSRLWYVSTLILVLSAYLKKSLGAVYPQTLKCFDKFNYTYITFKGQNLTVDEKWKLIIELNVDFEGISRNDRQYELYNDGVFFKNNTLEILPKNFFSLVPNLDFLELLNNRIQIIEEGTFSSLKNLVHLILDNNDLLHLPSKIFSDLILLRYLFIRKNNLTTLPAGIFDKNVNLSVIKLSFNLFTSLPEDLFKNNKNLKLVYINNIFTLTYLPSGLLSNFTNLSFVDLSNCNISSLPSNLFEGSINLKIILLHENALQTLPLKIFVGLKYLSELRLDRNQIAFIPNNVFQSCNDLQQLYMNNNKIVAINSLMFTGLSKISHVLMSNNRIKYIVGDKFAIFSAEMKIDFSHSNIGDSNSLKSFFNKLYVIFKRIKSLNLSYNKLKFLKSYYFQGVKYIEYLNLSHNLITSLKAMDLCLRSSTLFTLDLSHNIITDIYLQNYSASSDFVFKLNIENNPLQCNCNLFDILTNLNRSFNKTVEPYLRIEPESLKCIGSKEYENISLSSINPKEYRCIPSEKEIIDSSMCPRTCDLWIKMYEEKLVFNCSDRNLTVAPERLCSFKDSNFLNELDLTDNRIKNFPNFQQPGYDKVTKLLLSYNEISTVPENALPNVNLEILTLDNNQLKNLPGSIIKQIGFNILILQLGNNPWECGCNALEFITFIQVEDLIMDDDNVKCEKTNLTLRYLDITTICGDKYLYLYIVILLFVFLFALTLVLSVYYRYQTEIKIWLYTNNLCLRFIAEEEVDKDKLYDAFISYSHEDEDFVINELVKNLENGPKSFKLCIHIRDWLAGECIPSQIVGSISNSKRTIIVLSPNFVTSNWAKLEFKTALQQGLDEKRTRIIVIIYGEIDHVDTLEPELKTYLKMNTFIKWGDPWFWDKLRYALPHK